jgi:hypothetical protein
MSGTKPGTKLSETHRTASTSQPDSSGAVIPRNALGAAHKPKVAGSNATARRPEGRSEIGASRGAVRKQCKLLQVRRASAHSLACLGPALSRRVGKSLVTSHPSALAHSVATVGSPEPDDFCASWSLALESVPHNPPCEITAAHRAPRAESIGQDELQRRSMLLIIVKSPRRWPAAMLPK